MKTLSPLGVLSNDPGVTGVDNQSDDDEQAAAEQSHQGQFGGDTFNFADEVMDILTLSVLNNDDAHAGNGESEVNNFSADDGDKINIAALLSGYDSSKDIADYLKVEDKGEGDDILLYLDRDGVDTNFDFGGTAFLTLKGVGTGSTSLDDLLNNQWLTVEA